MTTSDKRSEALDKALANLNKKYSAGTVMKLGDRKVTKVGTFSTGSLTVDLATGIGGIPRGRITEIYGPESSGKTTLALHAIADAQKKGEAVAFIDVEHALDPVYAQNLGVNLDELIFSQPDTGEQALEIMEELINSSAIGLIVLDSVAALVPKSELEGDMGQSSVGVQARLMSQALRKITGSAQKNNCALLFINQLREKIGVMFGSPEVTTGGKALKFYASMRFDIRRIESLKEGTDIVGNRTRVKIVKNKMAPPFKQGESDIMYGKGFSREGDLITFGVDLNIIKKSGSWYTYQGDQLGQGKENVRQFLKDNSGIAEEIEAKITEILLPTENSNEEEDGTAEDVSPGK